METQSHTSFQVTQKYSQRDDQYSSSEPTLNCALPIMGIPVIDLGLLQTSSASASELDKLRSALGSWGCFQAINHGMTLEFLDNIRYVSRRFFELPMEEKQKYSGEGNKDFQGYANHSIFMENQERLSLAIYPEDLRKLELWPEKPQVFGSILDEYSKRLNEVIKVVFKAMARSLSLEENCFLAQYGERTKVSAKFGLYPRCDGPGLVLGQKPHADGSAITTILQDGEVEGLQFLKDDQWFRVPIAPAEALLVNVVL